MIWEAIYRAMSWMRRFHERESQRNYEPIDTTKPLPYLPEDKDARYIASVAGITGATGAVIGGARHGAWRAGTNAAALVAANHYAHEEYDRMKAEEYAIPAEIVEEA